METKFCKCGCGETITPKRHHRWAGIPDYVHGHNSRIEHPMQGRKHSPKTLQKLSDSHMGLPSGAKGLKHSEKSRKQMSESHMGVPLSAEHCKSLSKKSIRAWANKSEEEREQWARNISAGEKGKPPMSPDALLRMAATKKGKRCSPATEFTSVIMKERYLDPAYIKKMMKAWNIRPNKPETLMLQLLNGLYPDQWKYTGDFSFTINGKSPDFTNCNGQKKIIEIFGDYWHRGQNPQDRIDVFAPFGYKTLVIWEHELKEINNVINNIHKFMEVI